MRITCPLNGERDLREFTIMGSVDYLDRPGQDGTIEALDDHLHLRDNPAGETRELWYHDPSGTWLVVTRNTVTHEILSTELAMELGK